MTANAGDQQEESSTRRQPEEPEAHTNWNCIKVPAEQLSLPLKTWLLLSV